MCALLSKNGTNDGEYSTLVKEMKRINKEHHCAFVACDLQAASGRPHRSLC